MPARLRRGLSDTFAWVNWRAQWSAGPGAYTLVCRAWDDAGNVQPLDPQAGWNLQGNGVNVAQQTSVIVQDGIGSALSQVPCQPQLVIPGADLPPTPATRNTLVS